MFLNIIFFNLIFYLFILYLFIFIFYHNLNLRNTKKTTVCNQFKEQLDHLMTMLKSTQPHYIRCIKPNEKKKESLFEGSHVLRQLRCAGVLETIKVRQAGFPSRKTFDKFIERYGFLSNVKNNNKRY